ncbi:MAG: aminotransferase class I/II-fold pyridoxal phosphate-dependent enzyme [Bacteroidetes bacterium]|nr:aminotransferase class I/II-fold pyridoxal phosphate-dependent enzyme [Bacteroidota bacterium]
MKKHFDTLQIHAGHVPDQDTLSAAVPLYQTASYQFKDTQHAADLFELRAEGYIYSRISNPTVAVLEERLAAIENGVGALALSSGHAAQFIAINNLLNPGQNLITSPFLYGGTVSQFKHSFKKLGIEVRFAKSSKPEDFEVLIDENTRGLYMETISNPGFEVPDFDAFSALSKKYDLPLIVDNTFSGGGYLCKAFDLGVNIVIESATKWISGNGTSIAGAIIDGGNYNWANGKFPQFTEPAEEYHGINFSENFKELAFIVRARVIGLRDFGSSLSPFNAFMIIHGLETLSLRMERHCSNALALAKYLKSHPKVDEVFYPGLPDDPNHEVAAKYLSNGFGGVLSFTVKGGKQGGHEMVDELKLVSHLANVGDAKTLIIQPSTTTHQQLTDEEQIAAGVLPGLLRVSVGLEHISDIIQDFEQAFTQSSKGTPDNSK